MAGAPTPEETARAIARCMVNDYGVRAGEIAPLMGIQLKLHPEFRADDMNKALEFMLIDKWIEPFSSDDTFIKLTALGYAEA